MTAAAAQAVKTLGEVGPRAIAQALKGAGLTLSYGAMSTRLRSDSPALATQLADVYRHFAYIPHWRWADIHVELRRARGLRRWVQPQVNFYFDGSRPFDPFPASSPLPMFEWGSNWLIGERLNHLLLLHAGVVERDGLALVLPAMPGSGKSTLTAALSLSGWRLLSDEFGAFDLGVGHFQAVLKPVGLKNQSIDVIERFAPHALLGPRFPKTRKGTVAHLGPDAQAVARHHEGARPGAVILPKWRAGSATTLEPLRAQTLFSALAFNAFNYESTGADGFRAVVRLMQSCPAWQLVYSDLDDALATINEKWPGVVAHHAQRDAGAAPKVLPA